MTIQSTSDDPLVAQPRAVRPAYATGQLLDAQDFTDEQIYHRGRLARALAFLAGDGTLAGLGVAYVPAAAGQVEEIRVSPGVAVDRLGRLVELPRPACLRLQPWYDARFAVDGGDTLTQSAYGNLGRFVSPRAIDDALALPARAVVADVFLRFAACDASVAPSFAEGPFDALNAVSINRLRDAYELLLIPRVGLDDAYTGLPLPPAAAVLGDPGGAAAARRDAMQDAVLQAYGASGRAGGDGGIAPSPELPPDTDPTAIFLARVLLPVGAADPPARTAAVPSVDNWSRLFLPAASLFAQWAGL